MTRAILFLALAACGGDRIVTLTPVEKCFSEGRPSKCAPNARCIDTPNEVACFCCTTTGYDSATIQFPALYETAPEGSSPAEACIQLAKNWPKQCPAQDAGP